MRVFKNKMFSRWAKSEGLNDDVLRSAVVEMEHGLIDADLGGNVVKKRVPLSGIGKRGGVRALLAYKARDKAFFVYGFAKNVRPNITIQELKALKHLAKTLLEASDKELTQAVNAGALIEVEFYE